MNNKKIKVLFVAADPSAGMVPFVTSIINILAKDSRFEVQALCVEKGKLKYTDVDDIHSKIHLVTYPTSLKGKFLYKIYPIKVIKLLKSLRRKEHFDVIHFLEGEFVLYYYIHFNPSNRYCLTIHDLHPHEREQINFKERFNSYLFKGRIKKLISTINNITTSSQSQYSELKLLYVDKNICFTHFPTLVTSSIKNGRKQVAETIHINKYILFFGSIDKYKGVDLLIDAFKSMPTTGVKLVIAGKGISYNQDNDANIVEINRFIEDEELKDLFQRALFVVYPYRSITMSGVLSIAYYFNKPVLLSDLSFFKENKTPMSFFFKCNDVIDLRDKLLSMINRKFSDACFYKEIYSEKTLADDYYKFYKMIK